MREISSLCKPRVLLRLKRNRKGKGRKGINTCQPAHKLHPFPNLLKLQSSVLQLQTVRFPSISFVSTKKTIGHTPHRVAKLQSQKLFDVRVDICSSCVFGSFFGLNSASLLLVIKLKSVQQVFNQTYSHVLHVR